MSKTSTIPRYRVNDMLNRSSDHASRFINFEKVHEQRINKEAEKLEDIGGRVTAKSLVMVILGIPAAFALAIFAAYNAQNSIAGLIDPLGENKISTEVLLGIGVGIMLTGMIFGHLIYLGISDGFKTDEHTGTRSTTSKFSLCIIGLLLSIFYVWFQFSIAKSAGEGIDEYDSFSNMPDVITGVAIIELAIGYFILHLSLGYIALYFARFLLSITSRKLNRAARSTNDTYRQYLLLLEAYNNENPDNKIESEGSPYIRRAIAYYSGINLNNENNSNELERQGTKVPVDPSVQPVDTSERNVAVQNNLNQNVPNDDANQEAANQMIEDFINDTTDDNLKI